ncbi:hypothetical protein HDU82_000610 [Entophlyctis luteolus]|nr:hypothetical protein HDU82_000610 [Entophlyctis luteolus]KAJ3388568.1 hypothetical protein HDU84_009666 [Entophlyctis sp. JEL0112]
MTALAETVDTAASEKHTLTSDAIAAKFITPQVQEEVIAEESTLPQRVIAVAVDDSPQAQYALNWTLEHLATPSDQICIMNVRPYAISDSLLGLGTGLAASVAAGEFYPAPGSYEFNEDYILAMETYNRDSSHALLRRFGDQVLARGVQCRAIALRGDPREEILQKVEELKPDMLVTGCRGLGMFAKAFRGSLSDYLTQNAKCVVIVPKMKQ